MAAPMKLISAGTFARTLLCTQPHTEVFAPIGITVRHRKSIDLRNPRPRPLKFRIIEELCKPILPPRLIDPARECAEGKFRKRSQGELHDYDKFLLTQVTKVFQTFDLLVAVQRLSMTGREYNKLKTRLYRKDLSLIAYPNHIYLQFITDNPRYKNLAPLFVGEGYMIGGRSDQLTDLMKLMKKDPYCTVLGGKVGDRLYTRAGLTDLAAIPNLETLHAQLSSILNQALARTTGLLQSHQQQLTANLNQYVKQQGEEST